LFDLVRLFEVVFGLQFLGDLVARFGGLGTWFTQFNWSALVEPGAWTLGLTKPVAD
jgi:hypothetical protein